MLDNLTGRPVIFNSKYHIKPIVPTFKSCIKDTNNFSRKLYTLPFLPEAIILCTIDLVGLYPNISHEGGMVTMRKAFDAEKARLFRQALLLNYWNVF